jgi:hypothetical protein
MRLPLHPLYRAVNLLIKVRLITGKLYRVPLELGHLRYAAQLLSLPVGPSASAAAPAPRRPPRLEAGAAA